MRPVATSGPTRLRAHIELLSRSGRTNVAVERHQQRGYEAHSGEGRGSQIHPDRNGGGTLPPGRYATMLGNRLDASEGISRFVLGHAEQIKRTQAAMNDINRDLEKANAILRDMENPLSWIKGIGKKDEEQNERVRCRPIP